MPFLSVLLMVGTVDCEAVPRTGTASQPATAPPANVVPVAQPIGAPQVIEWDGVTKRVLMSRLRSTNYRNAADSATYAFGRGRWTRVLASQSLPYISPSQEVALAYDTERNQEILVYGTSSGPVRRAPATWKWDGTAWTEITTTHPMPVLSYPPSAAYSPDLHAVVMIGRCTLSTNPAGDTLLFDRGDWRSVWTPNTPRCPAKLAYSRLRHKIVALSFVDNRTWEFDGHDWLATPPVGSVIPVTATSPPIGNQMTIYSYSVAFDVKRDTWVLFGGFKENSSLATTWTGGGTWTVRSPVISPIGRSGSGMVWDPSLDAIVLFGGFVVQTGPNYHLDLGDTWSWDGSEWHQLAGPDYNSTPPSPVPNT